MKKGWFLFAVCLAGCSTHPLVDALDYFKPGTFGANEVQPYGGVCIPQGPVQPPANPPLIVPGALGDAPPPFAPIGVVPPPAPLPGIIAVPTPPDGAAPPPAPIFPRPGL